MRRVLFLAMLLAVSAAAPQDWPNIELEIEPIGDGLYVLSGPGGNIGLSVGPDGAFLIDDQYAPLTEKLLAAVSTVTDLPVRFVLNTHWHHDHTGGNENLGKAGAIIVAQENVRRRMNPAEFADVLGSTQQAPPPALPIVTFSDAINFYWNGQRIEARHTRNAHTDGDVVIWLSPADVVHMGDNFVVHTYPFIDVDSGGSVDGMIATVNRALRHVGKDTRIIPGHGPVSRRGDLRAFRDMLQTVRDRVAAMIEQGMSEEEVVAATPSADFDDRMQSGFMNPEKFVRQVYDSLSR